MVNKIKAQFAMTLSMFKKRVLLKHAFLKKIVEIRLCVGIDNSDSRYLNLIATR
jgi:hypothetical protein